MLLKVSTHADCFDTNASLTGSPYLLLLSLSLSFLFVKQQQSRSDREQGGNLSSIHPFLSLVHGASNYSSSSTQANDGISTLQSPDVNRSDSSFDRNSQSNRIDSTQPHNNSTLDRTPRPSTATPTLSSSIPHQLYRTETENSVGRRSSLTFSERNLSRPSSAASTNLRKFDDGMNPKSFNPFSDESINTVKNGFLRHPSSFGNSDISPEQFRDHGESHSNLLIWRKGKGKQHSWILTDPRSLLLLSLPDLERSLIG